jgi:hypothetical protein
VPCDAAVSSVRATAVVSDTTSSSSPPPCPPPSCPSRSPPSCPSPSGPPPHRPSSSWILVFVVFAVVLSFAAGPIGIAWVSPPLGGGSRRGRAGVHMCTRWPWARRRGGAVPCARSRRCLVLCRVICRYLVARTLVARNTLVWTPVARADPACCGVLRACRAGSCAACAFWDPACRRDPGICTAMLRIRCAEGAYYIRVTQNRIVHTDDTKFCASN